MCVLQIAVKSVAFKHFDDLQQVFAFYSQTGELVRTLLVDWSGYKHATLTISDQESESYTMNLVEVCFILSCLRCGVRTRTNRHGLCSSGGLFEIVISLRKNMRQLLLSRPG